MGKASFGKPVLRTAYYVAENPILPLLLLTPLACAVLSHSVMSDSARVAHAGGGTPLQYSCLENSKD